MQYQKDTSGHYSYHHLKTIKLDWHFACTVFSH